MQLAGNNVVVTGGSGALGSIVVEEFQRLGGRISVPVRQGQSSVKGAAFVSPCDLGNEEQARRFFNEAEKHIGPTDVLVCLAGGFVGGSLVEETSEQELENQFRMNFLTTHHAVCMTVGGMKQRKCGRIVTIAAMPAVQPAPRREAYAVSKAAVVTLTQTVSREVHGTGVTCNAIAPSIIKTKANMEGTPAEKTAGWVPPEEIAALITFLCSREAASINGNVIKIFGGV